MGKFLYICIYTCKGKKGAAIVLIGIIVTEFIFIVTGILCIIYIKKTFSRKNYLCKAIQGFSSTMKFLIQPSSATGYTIYTKI